MEFSKEIKDNNVKYICGGIKYVIENFGKRDPGSEGEKKAQEYMGGEIAKYSDNVVMEEFKLNPGSFFGWIPITVTLGLLASLIYFYMPLVTVALVFIAVIPLLTQFVFYKKTFDPLFLEKTSHNITATKKPSGEIKRRIVFSGHADATWEWTHNYKFGGIGFAITFVISLLGLVYLLTIAIVSCVKNGVGAQFTDFGNGLTLGICVVAFFPFWISMYFFSNKKIVVDGANDNLTACYMSIAVLKTLKEESIKLENTEVVVMLTGSEEAGLRGAKAWCKAHFADYNDVETIFIPLETLREIKYLTIYNKDLNGLVKTDADVCNLLKKSAKAVGYDVPFGTVSVGATDAAAFAQAGRKTACLAAMNHNLQPYYHTRLDSYDNISSECLAAVLDIALETLNQFDKSGL